jgi:hypothetical protein
LLSPYIHQYMMVVYMSVDTCATSGSILLVADKDIKKS